MNISEMVKHEIKRNSMTPAELARRMGYAPQYVYDLLSNDRRWNETTISKACEVLGMEFKLTKSKLSKAKAV